MMFGHYANSMTKTSSYLVDWSRVGELAGSGTYRYTKDELLVRAGIVTATAVTASIFGWCNNPEKTGFSSTVMTMGGAALGFVASHAVVIYPLVKKRWVQREECNALIESIKSQSDSPKIAALIDHILTCSRSDEKHSRASQTWGYRYRLLDRLYGLIQANGDKLALLALSNDQIVKQLDEPTVNKNDSQSP